MRHADFQHKSIVPADVTTLQGCVRPGQRTQVKLMWDVAVGATEYDIARCPGICDFPEDFRPDMIIHTVFPEGTERTLSYTDSKVSPGLTYTYFVFAVDGKNGSKSILPVSLVVSIPAPTSTPTPTPTNSPTPTYTPTPTLTPTPTPTATLTPTPTYTPTPTPVSIPARSSGSTYIANPTATPTAEPTYTPMPTPSATPTITPTPEFVILEITPVVVEESHSEVVETIQPDTPGQIVSPDGTVSVLFPALSRRITFQAGVSADDKHCLSGAAPPGVILSCVRVDTFDRFGGAEADAVLTTPATLNIILDDESGDLPITLSILARAYEAGGISLMFREYLAEEWSEIPFSLSPTPEGKMTASATRDRFGVFALTADTKILEGVTSDMSPTPTVTPLPTPLPESSRPAREWPGAIFGLLIAMLAPIILKLWQMAAVGINW